MHGQIKGIFLFTITVLAMQSCIAWNIGNKGRTTGPTIHTTYFLTTNNGSFPVRGQICVGQFLNGSCACNNATYDIGTITLKSGDTIAIDGFSLRSIIGSGYSCMTIFYTYKQTVRETFQLNSHGYIYDVSFPATSEVTIL